MIKYSLIVLAAAAVIMSSGCDDSECCGGKKDVSKPVVKNVAPVITSLFGTTNSIKECTAGNSVPLSANERDENGNVDTSTYSWVERVGTSDAPLSANVACPAEGETTKVCATVEDKEGLKSNEVCVTLKGKAAAAPVAQDCPPLKVTAKEQGTGGATVTELKTGSKYDFTYANACPDATCKWTFTSTHENGGSKDCIKDKHVTKENGDPLTETDNTASTAVLEVKICKKEWKQKTLNVQVNCTGGKMGDRSSEMRTYQFTDDK